MVQLTRAARSVRQDDKPILVTHRLYLGALRAAFNADALHAAYVARRVFVARRDVARSRGCVTALAEV